MLTHAVIRDFRDQQVLLCQRTILYFAIVSQIGWYVLATAMNVSPCHHGTARPQVADGGTAFNMEGSCE